MDVRHTRNTPMTERLVGATARLMLNTPSREGSAMDVDSVSDDVSLIEEHSGKPNTKQSVLRKPHTADRKESRGVEKCPTIETREGSEEREQEEREHRENFRREKQNEARRRAEAKRLRMEAVGTPEVNPNGHRNEDEGATAVGRGLSGTEVDGEGAANEQTPKGTPAYANSSPQRDLEKADEDIRNGAEGADALCPAQSTNRVRTGGRPGAQVAGARRGRSQSQAGGRLGNRGQEDAGGQGDQSFDADEDPGSASTAKGSKKSRKQPQEDRLLLLAAAKHMATSQKRDRKKKVQFGEQA